MTFLIIAIIAIIVIVLLSNHNPKNKTKGEKTRIRTTKDGYTYKRPKLSEVYDLGGRAGAGDPEAQYNIGTLFYYGDGVNRNCKIAIDWYNKAAKQGHVKARAALEKMKNEGFDIDSVIREINIQKNARKKRNDATPVVNNPQTNVTINAANYGLQDKYIKAQNSKLLFDKAVELKRKGQYTAALTLYKSAYESYPDDPDVQSTMYAMAKIYLLIGDYEKACALFQDGLTMKLSQAGERTGRFYQKYVMNRFSGGLSESDPDYQWFQNLTADYSIFIGLSHYLLENDGAELLSRYRYDFNNHMQSVAGKPANRPSAEYLQTCYEYGWVRVILIASEFADRGLSDIYIDHVKERKQEFLDILKTI